MYPPHTHTNTTTQHAHTHTHTRARARQQVGRLGAQQQQPRQRLVHQVLGDVAAVCKRATARVDDRVYVSVLDVALRMHAARVVAHESPGARFGMWGAART